MTSFNYSKTVPKLFIHFGIEPIGTMLTIALTTNPSFKMIFFSKNLITL